jgi:DNA modification methylase
MTHKIITGEAIANLKTLKSETVDLIITSPPYDDLRAYEGYVFDFPAFRKMARQLYRVLKPGGVLVWVVADATNKGTESLTSMKQALYFKENVGFLAYDTMVYHRSSVPLTKRRYEQHFEYMFVMTKGMPKTFNGLRVPKLYPEKRPRVKAFGRNRNNSRDYGTVNLALADKLDGNVWKINCQRASKDPHGYEHPAIFPEELAQRHIVSWSNPGDVVLDPMCGSGTVGKQAALLGRTFIGIEICPSYVEIAKRRLASVHEVPRTTVPQSQVSAV